MTPQPLVLKDLEVSYKLAGNRTADVLRGVSLSVDPGEVVGVIGEGGSGKSTLVEASVGLLGPSAHVDGAAEVFGRDIARLPRAEQQAMRGAQVGTILSGGRALLNPMARVGDQIGNVLRDHGVPERERAERTMDLLRQVGIPDPARRVRAYPHELSGGMAQRIVIAIAIACGPRLIVADEPTRGLDVTIAADILDLMRELIRAGGVSALIATRDLGIVAQYCDRIVVLRDGRVDGDYPVRAFFPEPPSEYGRKLLEAEYSAVRARARSAGTAMTTTGTDR